MKNFKLETEKRVKFIKELVENSKANGIVLGCSGGKDSALVAILCKMACDNTVGITLPCNVSQNFNQDMEDSKLLCEKFNIELKNVDLSAVKNEMVKAVSQVCDMTEMSSMNIAPRLRMATVYAVAGAENRLVAGTGNKSEAYVGYFTKWGDGAHDFNPIADLTVTEIFEFLRYLDAPLSIIEKKPSAALKEGQTDEGEMGVTYAELDKYITTGEIENLNSKAKIDALHNKSEHKRQPIVTFK